MGWCGAMLMIGLRPGRLVNLGRGDQRNEFEMLEAGGKETGHRAGDQRGEKNPPQH